MLSTEILQLDLLSEVNMTKIKAPKCKDKDELKAWLRSKKNVDKASIKAEKKRIKRGK